MSATLPRQILRLCFIIGSLLLATLIACQTDGPETDRTPASTIQSASLVPQEIPITTLLRNPVTFEGQTIWVTGQYRSLPLLVCGTTTHRSPATWTLVFGDVQTYVSGFDEALRPITDSGLSLTVEGRWQKWEGPVGCGRRAPIQEIWYLAASRIVSPNPLVRSEEGEEVVVVLPSPTADIEIEEEPTTDETGQGEPTEEPEEDDSPTRTPSPTFQSIPSPLPGPTNTPSSSPTTDTTGGGSGTPTPTITASVTPTATSGTAASGTGTPTSTASVTATTAGTTPGATATPADQGIIGFGLTGIEKQSLTANSPHSWQFTPPADEQITITAGSTNGLNINLDLVAPDGTVIVKANSAGAGKAETIVYTTPNPTGAYKIIVSGAPRRNRRFCSPLPPRSPSIWPSRDSRWRTGNEEATSSLVKRTRPPFCNRSIF
jgi:hypothetical protein